MEIHEGLPEAAVEALDLVRTAGLSHPRGALVESFLTQAADPELAAQYLIDRVAPAGDARDAPARLAALHSDWSRLVSHFAHDAPGAPLRDRRHVPVITRREAGVCRLTGLGGSWRDRLDVYPVFPGFGTQKLEIDLPLHDLVLAFLGPNLGAWVLSGCVDSSAPLGSHWLLRASSAAALARGYWSLQAWPTLSYEVSTCRRYSVFSNGIGGTIESRAAKAIGSGADFRLFDERGCDTDLPDPRALELVARVSVPARWARVSRAIERRRNPRRLSSAAAALAFVFARLTSRVFSWCSRPLARVFSHLWPLVPDQARIWAYLALRCAGTFMYGPTKKNVQRLPFGMFLKFCKASANGPLTNEYDTLKLIKRWTDLPVPQPLDFVSDSTRSYMVTSRIPGQRMGAVFNMLSGEQEQDLAMDLNKFLGMLRAIPTTARPSTVPTTAVTGTMGGRCFNVRMELMFGDRKVCGPFATEDDFHEFIQPRRPPPPEEVQRGGHDIVMTHGDLSQRNILVNDDGTLAGIVDWEHAGWYPAYWEYTGFLYGLGSSYTHHRLTNMSRSIFQGFDNFEFELGVERRLWERIF